MKHTLLLMKALLPSVMETLENRYTIHRYWEADDPDSLLLNIEADCVGVVTDGGRGVESAILQRLPKVAIVSVFGVGVDAVDLDYCRQHNIAVTNTPDVLSDDVADLAIALALAVSRQVVVADQYARQGRWEKEGPMQLTRRLTGKTAGIYGMGSIGDALARRLDGFAMQVSYCNRNEKSNSKYRFVSSLTQLAMQVDYLFITASANTETIGAVDENVLDALGPDGYLINVSRGSLIKEPVLVDFLEQHRIAGAGLDVFVDEPRIPDSLSTMDHVVLQPHVASGTWETRQAMGKLVLDNLEAHFNQSSLLTPVA
ncbi:MAG: 2-hydroxyacid dehydrogenase [Granulosicoccus sp.]|nr:2-hydroxyacid dehydrogenase [Granulosicoccus sp.]